MPKNMQDIKTRAYVLRRTNYAEADRILNLITPEGKISAIAKGVRKSKSKLAGGVELFSLTEVCVHMGRGEMGILTSAKMLKYYDKLVADFERMELAAMVLRKISMAAESSDAPEYFAMTDAALSCLNDGTDTKLVESWFLLNLSKVLGEEVNVYRDANGEKLAAECCYDYDAMEGAFLKREHGEFGANEIKLLRLMLTADLNVVRRVKNTETMLPQILRLARVVSKMM